MLTQIRKPGLATGLLEPLAPQNESSAGVSSVQYYRDDIGELYGYPPTFFATCSDMTAIVAVHIKSGFVIAADGRSRWDDESTSNEMIRSRESDYQQKIFPIERKD